jgi:ATP-dependent RNA helicase DeaD
MTFKETKFEGRYFIGHRRTWLRATYARTRTSIPFMLEKTADLVALAQTGTGKTAAFGLPVLNMIDATRKEVQALVLAPTRELCIQIANDLKGYSKNMRGMRIVPVYGAKIFAHNFVSWKHRLKSLWLLPDV